MEMHENACEPRQSGLHLPPSACPTIVPCTWSAPEIARRCARAPTPARLFARPPAVPNLAFKAQKWLDFARFIYLLVYFIVLSYGLFMFIPFLGWFPTKIYVPSRPVRALRVVQSSRVCDFSWKETRSFLAVAMDTSSHASETVCEL